MNCHGAIGCATHIEFDCVGAHLASSAECRERILPLNLGGTAVRYYLNFSHNALIIAEVFLLVTKYIDELCRGDC
jgi:hypothetical protein